MPLVTMGALFGGLEPQQQDEVLERLGEEAAARFLSYYEMLLGDAIGLRDLKGVDALNALRARPPEDWAALQAADPERAKAGLLQWAKLDEEAQKRLAHMIQRVAGDSVKSLVNSRTSEKKAAAQTTQNLPLPQF